MTNNKYYDIIVIEIQLQKGYRLLTAEEKFRYYLKERGLKFTPERDAILKTVFTVHGHFDVEELYKNLSENDKNISRATIYRTIPLLQECNLIQETLYCVGNTKYEYIYEHEHHDHLVCLKCGSIIEFFDGRIEKLQEEICKRYQFNAVEHRLGIKGYCKECQKKDEK